MTRDPSTDLPRCGLPRRLAAIAYDTLLLMAVIFVVAALILPFTKSEAALRSAVLFASFFFFGWFWTHGGQTLGMRAWRVRVQGHDGGPITWMQALLRFLAAILSWAILGAGFLWSLVDREGRTWHDIYSESVLVVLPRKR